MTVAIDRRDSDVDSPPAERLDSEGPRSRRSRVTGMNVGPSESAAA